MDWILKLISQTKNRIFLDYASATPVRREVRKVMERYWSKDFYNPSAIYEEGIWVRESIGEYRGRIARIVGAGSKEIIFTSSGTESDNLAILGAFEAFREAQKKEKNPISKPHIIISAIEHPAVMRAAEEVVRRGGELSVVPVNEEGLISPERVRLALKHNTFLVSVGLANSEIGTVEPIAKIGRVVREERKKNLSEYPLLHTDASQAASYLSINLEQLHADMLTLDGSKIYGPKGVGILATRRGVRLHPVIHGGGQERGLRGGTLNPALIAGFTLALEIAQKEKDEESVRLAGLRRQFIDKVREKLPEAIVNGSEENQLPSILSISIPGVLAEFLVLKLDREGILASVGTACSLDERISGSPVIREMGKPELAESTIRFSFGKFLDEKLVKKAVEIFCSETKKMLK